MAKHVENEYSPDSVSPPGETLQELLTERNLSQAELATRMGRPKKTINEIVKGKAAITPDTALELELVLGVPAPFWNARERNYRASLAQMAQRARLEQQTEWMRRFPLKDLIAGGWVPPVTKAQDRVRALLAFFGVASDDQWDALVTLHQSAFRKSASFESNPEALTAWLRCGVIDARELDCEAFDRDRFVDVLHAVRHLTTEEPGVFQPEMTRLAASAGVAVVLVPQLPKSRVSGATRWLSPDRALIQLSLRYRTDDHFWFTFFHEAAHILLHGKKFIFLETLRHEGDLEEEANQWAADFLIPPDEYATLVLSRDYGESHIAAFAEQLGIAAGIVVGRLQHDHKLPHSHCNALKRRFTWVDDPTPAA